MADKKPLVENKSTAVRPALRDLARPTPIVMVENLGSAPSLSPFKPHKPTLRNLPPPPLPSRVVDVDPGSISESQSRSRALLEDKPALEASGESLAPAPWDPAADSMELKRAVARLGSRVVKAPESKSDPWRPELPWYQSAFGFAKVLGAFAAALTVSTASIVAIIGALREPTAPKLREDVDLARKEIAGLRAYTEQKDIARSKAFEKKFDSFKSRLDDLDSRYPEPKKKRVPKEIEEEN